MSDRLVVLPEGWKLVPVEPTQEWVANLEKVRIGRMESVIEDVLAAAPAAPVVQAEQEPVATILPPDPLDERTGPWLSPEGWERLRALPAGTRLYTTPAAPAAQGEPAAVAITEKQVMTAYLSASRLHISGTSNWVAAFAQSLNKQIAAQPDSALVDALENARRAMHAVLAQEPRLKAVAKRVLTTEIARIDAALAGKGGAQ